MKKAFDFLDSIDRVEKPRNKGITMVLDKGMGFNAAKDLMEYADYIDIIKLGWGTPRFCSEEKIKERIKLYTKNGILVSNGGTLFEIAHSLNKFDQFLNYAKKIGLTLLEISSGITEISKEDKEKYIKKAKELEFNVFAEIGKKDPEKDIKLTMKQRIDEAKMDIELGVSKIIIEAREGGKGIGVFDQNGNIKEDMVKDLVTGIGLENILFEAPLKNQQVYFILNFGPDVNLGNIRSDDILGLETLRRGFRGDTFGRL
ncbi:phosphosulfolactate synthase [Candidatus Methanoliparum sp. LAM-1]|uniref:phosphosulfolactate synthase n=1 Tax=Candidatus Methanoliparum sp. LAM-1 TaxID=2874846 RepID=UPI001E504A6C|nr:phosphosulfolactate synthase [Candidatus Methanoliparum sp. LAM-1]BDC35606.1 phosphosulfolactate synthase [Candidatus Methanoliparum sp. LAM-1]